MRLCGRSPKDGEPLDRTVPMAKYRHHLARMAEQNGGAALGGNAKMVAVGRTTPSWLKVGMGLGTGVHLLSVDA